MRKRLIVFSFIILAMFYGTSGIYFMYKSFNKKFPKPLPTRLYYDLTRVTELKQIAFDFETESTSGNFKTSNEKSTSGTMSFKMLAEQEYAGEIVQPFSGVQNYGNMRQIEVTFNVWNQKKSEGLKWVVEITDENGKSLSWQSDNVPSTYHKWETATLHFDINPDLIKDKYLIKTYPWNRDKNFVYIDDLKVVYQSLKNGNDTIREEKLKPSTFYFDLENDSTLLNRQTLDDGRSRSGKWSSYIGGTGDTSVIISKKVSDIINYPIDAFYAGVWLYPLSDDNNCSLVMEIRTNNNELKYFSYKNTEKYHMKAGSWQKINFTFSLTPDNSNKISLADRVCVFLVNNTGKNIYADDFEITFGNVHEPSGDTSVVNMNKLKYDSYKFDRYRPPFAISHLTKSDIHNGDSQFLIKTGSFTAGDIKPDAILLTGNFTGIIQDRDELLAISETEIQIYHFCDNLQRFVLSGKTPFEKKKYNLPQFIAGDFNGDSKSELLVISGKKYTLMSFRSAGKMCSDNTAELNTNIEWEGIEGFEAAKSAAGNFSGSKNHELFLTDNNGNWVMKSFTASGWKNISEGNSPGVFGVNCILSAGKISKSAHDVLLAVNSDNKTNACSLISFEQNNLQTIYSADETALRYIFNEPSYFFPFMSNDNSEFNFLTINHSDRFSMKEIGFDKKEFYVHSVPEFRGYSGDRNPKYYEFPRFITGNFTGKKSSLLCILYNCADKFFDGNHCIKYDSLPDLPNSIQLYNFSE